MKDMVEWNIKTTSDKCPHTEDIESYWEVCGVECDHPENGSRHCSSEKCPIIIKEKNEN